MAYDRDIQNRASCHVGMVTMERWHFREIFGTNILVVKKNWELLERDSLLSEGGRPKHLLWALDFMKVYPKQSPGCLAVGAPIQQIRVFQSTQMSFFQHLVLAPPHRCGPRKHR